MARNSSNYSGWTLLRPIGLTISFIYAISLEALAASYHVSVTVCSLQFGSYSHSGREHSAHSPTHMTVQVRTHVGMSWRINESRGSERAHTEFRHAHDTMWCALTIALAPPAALLVASSRGWSANPRLRGTTLANKQHGDRLDSGRWYHLQVVHGGFLPWATRCRAKRGDDRRLHILWVEACQGSSQSSRLQSYTHISLYVECVG